MALKERLPLITKGTLAVADQGVFAASNFLLNILLARWLTPTDYGAFALAYSVFLVLLIAHTALITTPMLVFVQSRHRERFAEYMGILLRGHFALVLPGSALLVLAAILSARFGHNDSAVVEHAFFALALGAPFILLLWLLRRAFYAQLKPMWAAASGVLYFIILIAGAVALHAAAALTPATAFLCMAVATLITCVLLLIRLRPAWGTDSSTMLAVALDHWTYGKWVAAGAGPNWIAENIYFLVLPATFGLAQVGALKALLNLAQPASQSISALGVLLMPILTRDRATGSMAKTMKLSTALFLSGSIVYIALLWVFRAHVFHSLYGNKFSAYNAWPLLAAGLIPIAQGLPNVAGAALGAIEKPKLGFWADSISAGFAFVAGIPLAIRLGVGGALLGIALSYTVMGFATLFFYLQAIRRSSKTNQPATNAEAA